MHFPCSLITAVDWYTKEKVKDFLEVDCSKFTPLEPHCKMPSTAASKHQQPVCSWPVHPHCTGASAVSNLPEDFQPLLQLTSVLQPISVKLPTVVPAFNHPVRASTYSSLESPRAPPSTARGTMAALQLTSVMYNPRTWTLVTFSGLKYWNSSYKHFV